jgi:hypothetical protein
MMQRTERIFILTALLFVGLGLTLVVSRGVVVQDAGQATLLLWGMAAILVLLAGSGSRWLRRGVIAEGTTGSGELAPLPDIRLPVVGLPLDTVVPGAMAAGFVIFLQFFRDGRAQTFIIVLGGLSFAALYWAQAHGRRTGDTYFGLAQSLLNIITHLTAFLFFSVMYGLKSTSVFPSLIVGAVAALLVFELLSRDAAWHRALDLPVEARRTTLVLLAVASGVVIAEVMWGLNYWAALTTLVGGAFLLVVFYVMAGLLVHYVDRGLTRGVVLELAIVGAVSVIVVFLSAFLAPQG